MKEIKDIAPSVLVFIMTGSDDEELAIEALRNNARNYLEKPGRKNIVPGADTPDVPGSVPSTITLSQNNKIQQALRFINENYRTDIRLNAAAREAGMSPSHFSRMFKKVIGLSYQEYVNKCRITTAKTLLRTSTRSIAEIAVFLGFADATGFGRIFKKLTGQTPSAYRSLRRQHFLPKKA